ncbi:MAG: hypothetical protein HXY38_16170 [Chloroflexi bacterium]|nr:hypothetical protein [Chloroflexota bacterium]
MPIYRKSNDKLSQIRERKIDKEKSLQKLVEENVSEIFGLTFVKTEHQLGALRIDTLAFDNETKSFVIIEYKKGSSFSVIDQGYSYLALLLNNKADFVLEYNERLNKNLRKDDVDWSQSRVIFIASSFTKYQQEAMGFQDLPIELWEAKEYENDLVSFNQIRASEKSESIKTIAKSKDIERVSKEVRQYSLDDHIKSNWDTARELFENFSQRILELDPRFEIKPVKYYIGFNIENKNVIAVKVRSNKLIIELLRVKPEDLKDSEKRTRYQKNSFKYYNKHITVLEVKNEDDVDYAIPLIKQVYKRFGES